MSEDHDETAAVVSPAMPQPPSEQIEGLGAPEDTTWGDYPIDTVLIRTESRTVFDVVRRIEKGSFVMDPDFQRDFIWQKDKQSKLIESVLMRIPLPVFYLAEDDLGNMVVVDGLQRLSTFRDFFENKLRLKLPEHPELDKKRFKDLSPKLQNRVEDCNLILYIIDSKVPERARLDIFERVNGGVPLTRQQMRNCLYMGQATRFLKEELSSVEFPQATGRSLDSSTMRDREFVNRFLAYYLLPLPDYKGDMDEFLAAALKKINKMKPEEVAELSRSFRRSLSNNFRVFGKHAFRKHTKDQKDRGILNASLWDVMTTGLASYTPETVDAKADQLREGFFKLLADPAFVASITYSPNSTKNAKYRFEATQAMLSEVFNADPA
jgi:hypothetical protein